MDTPAFKLDPSLFEFACSSQRGLCVCSASRPEQRLTSRGIARCLASGGLQAPLQISTTALSNAVLAGLNLPRILQAAPYYAPFLGLGLFWEVCCGSFQWSVCRLVAGTGLPGHGTLNRRQRGPQVKDCCHCSGRVVFCLPAYVDADFLAV